ncbi:MAG: hypothetical protein WHX52_11335 [Anaerolineae bacterium]
MEHILPLILYTCLLGGVLLLGISAIPRLHFLRKPVNAGWLTLLAFLWLLLPQQGRWLPSLWAPGSVLGGQILLDLTPAVWWLGLMVTLIFCGMAWFEVAERRETPRLSEIVVMTILVLTWLTLMSGSLLTMLAMWAVFDLAWGIAGLMSGANSERVVFGMALHGIASLTLWAVSLYMLQSGVSELWWLMWPSPSMLTLLLVAAFMRIGFYPFQITFPEGLGLTRSLSLVYFMGPVTGMALLYRLMTLPGVERLPEWVMTWGVLAMLWNALIAWGGRRQPTMTGACLALFIGLVTGACSSGSASLLLFVSGLWAAGGALLALGRGRDRQAIAWTWTTWLAVLFFLGAPPSPVSGVFGQLIEELPWALRAALLVGMSCSGAIFIQRVAPFARGAVTPPTMWQRIAMIGGLGIIAAMLIAATLLVEPTPFSWLGFGFWLLSILGAGILVRWGKPLRERTHYLQPIMEFFDLQWLYRSIWRGTEHLLGVLRITADVVEGSASLLWSLLILLLILLVVGNQ